MSCVSEDGCLRNAVIDSILIRHDKISNGAISFHITNLKRHWKPYFDQMERIFRGSACKFYFEQTTTFYVHTEKLRIFFDHLKQFLFQTTILKLSIISDEVEIIDISLDCVKRNQINCVAIENKDSKPLDLISTIRCISAINAEKIQYSTVTLTKASIEFLIHLADHVRSLEIVVDKCDPKQDVVFIVSEILSRNACKKLLFYDKSPSLSRDDIERLLEILHHKESIASLNVLISTNRLEIQRGAYKVESSRDFSFIIKHMDYVD